MEEFFKKHGGIALMCVTVCFFLYCFMRVCLAALGDF